MNVNDHQQSWIMPSFKVSWMIQFSLTVPNHQNSWLVGVSMIFYLFELMQGWNCHAPTWEPEQDLQPVSPCYRMSASKEKVDNNPELTHHGEHWDRRGHHNCTRSTKAAFVLIINETLTWKPNLRGACRLQCPNQNPVCDTQTSSAWNSVMRA